MIRNLRQHKFAIAKNALYALILNTICALGAHASKNEKAQINNCYSQLASFYMPSLAKQALEEQKQAKKIKKINKEQKADPKKINSFKNIQVQQLGDVEKLRILYNMYSADLGHQNTNPILQHNAIDDLELFCGDKPELDRHLFSTLDNTQTSMGKIALQKMIKELTDDPEELKRRQAIVKELVENEELFNSLNEKLATIKDAENDFFWFWKTIDEQALQFFDIVFYQWKIFDGLNNKEAALEYLFRHRTVLAPMLTILSPIIALELGRQTLNTSLALMTDAPVRVSINIIPSIIRYFFELLTFRETNIHLIDFFNISNLSAFEQQEIRQRSARTVEISNRSRLIMAVAFAIPTFIILRAFWQNVQTGMLNNKVSFQIQEKMIRAAAVTNSMVGIGNLLGKDEKLSALLPNLSAITDAFTPSKNKDRAELLNKLRSNTFKGNASFLSLKGSAHKAFKSIHNVKNTFVDSLQSIGEIDAYLSIAKLFKKHANNENGTYCFANFVNQKTPYINIKNYWHPMLDPKKVVTNDIELGQLSEPRNIILTGPNAGGKSTNLKSITIALILAQSFGIAPAQEMTITPFGLINTYLNIADTEGKESLFQAEMHRAQDLLNQIRMLKDKKSFVIMDEIFTGTNPKEGMAAAYGIAKKLSTFGHNMAVIATHFQVLTDLAKDTNGKFENYKVYIDRDAQGGIVYPYKMVKGITDQAIALELLEAEGFDNDILQDAFNVINNKHSDSAPAA